MPDVSNSFETGGWEFNKKVVEVFDEHVNKNVPNYDLIQKIIVDLSDWLLPDESNLVDVGASTGTTARQISLKHPKRKLSFYLYDIEEEMLNAAREKNSGHLGHHRFLYINSDLTEHQPSHEEADVSLSIFTLQFIPRHKRGQLLKNLAEKARESTGTLIVAEKLEQETGFWQEVANEATWDYKQDSGIDDETIRSKARSLRGVLVPLKEKELIKLIEENGWKETICVYKFHNWGIYISKVR
jgi:tRNA (cmo5U34)-methyltransferase